MLRKTILLVSSKKTILNTLPSGAPVAANFSGASPTGNIRSPPYVIPNSQPPKGIVLTGSTLDRGRLFLQSTKIRNTHKSWKYELRDYRDTR